MKSEIEEERNCSPASSIPSKDGDTDSERECECQPGRYRFGESAGRSSSNA